jgi:hydrophobic/amphiphilic exporter-1 (mainly G- bacteria), HAE1 family
MWFTRISIANPVLATMMMLAFVVLGLFSYNRLAVDQFPDVNFPVVVVSTEYPGASPEIIETDVTRPIEEQVNSISGIKRLSSRSYEGASVVIAEFDLLTDPARATQDVREKVSQLRVGFKREVREPVISRFEPDEQPVLSLAIRAPGREAREVTAIAEQVVKRRIENARGVGRVTVVGGVEREVQVYLKTAEMEALRVGVDQVLAALRNENQELPAGALVTRDREQSVQIRGRLTSVADFERIVVARRGGQPVYLSQVASVVDGQQELDSLALVNGERAIALDVIKAQGENTIAVVDGVKRLVDELSAQLPRDVRIEVVRDQSTPIRNSVAGVKANILEGAILAIVIVFLFLSSWRSTVITGLTLPISLIGTCLVMYLMGFTINMVTLLALSICVGLLIDDAIVVRENIVRHQAMGKHHRDAALDGTREIALAVTATTFTIVAVFLPVGFMGGVIGQFFKQFGVTVAFAVVLSMFISFTLDPMLSAVWDDPDAGGAKGNGPLARLLRRFEAMMKALERGYVRLLEWGLRHRWPTMAVAALSFIAAVGLVRFVGAEFVPQPDNNELYVQYHTPAGSSLELTQVKTLQVEAALREFPQVLYTYAKVNTGVTQGRNYASVFVKLVDRRDRDLSVQQLVAPVRDRLQRIAGITVTNTGVFNQFGNKQIEISVQGPDQRQLEALAALAVAEMRRIPGVVDLDTSSKPARPTIAVEVNRALASDLGIGVAQIGAALRPLLAGEAATSWKAPDDENYEVRVRLPVEGRQDVDDLARIPLTSSQLSADGAPRMVPLRQVATLVPTTGPTQINRRDMTREVMLSANVYGAPAGTVGLEIERRLAGIPTPPGYAFVTGGATRDMQESFGFAVQALALAVIFIYMILASQFRSFLQPVAIMAALPLSLIGVVLALLAWRSTLNIFSIIGFIMLMGLVTKNAILLVDFANRQRREGIDRTRALLAAAEIRLRPILMTTLAMIFGMLPLAVSTSEGAEQRSPMAHAVIGGLLASTLLTLVVVPVLYSLLDDLVQRLGRRQATLAEPVESPVLDPRNP